jgi:CubicO group peptidase (beta-lactamase class C family)
VTDALDALAAGSAFSGAVRIDDPDGLTTERAYGYANRAFEIPNTTETRFAIASGSKTFTALAVLSLVDDGALELSTRARKLLGADLPLIDDAVTAARTPPSATYIVSGPRSSTVASSRMRWSWS